MKKEITPPCLPSKREDNVLLLNLALAYFIKKHSTTAKQPTACNPTIKQQPPSVNTVTLSHHPRRGFCSKRTEQPQPFVKRQALKREQIFTEKEHPTPKSAS